MRTILFAVLITLSLATNAQKLLLLADEIPASSLSFEQRERLDAVESDELASEIRIGRFSLETLRTMQHQMQPAERTSRASKDSYSIYSHDEKTGDEISLVIMGQDVLGRIREDGQTYRVKPLGDGVTAIYRYDMSRLRQHPEGYEDFIKEQQDEIQPDQGSQIPIFEGENDGSVIDLMVVYTSRAKEEAGNIDALIELNINKTNRIYEDSGIQTRIRLVHTHFTTYRESSSMLLSLLRLRLDGEALMDEVHDLRDQYAADLVMLLRSSPVLSGTVTCGIGYLLNPTNPYYPKNGFSVVGANCAAVTDTFYHELGHNQGAAHNPHHGTNPYFAYGHGLCGTANGWNTVMSYQTGADGDCFADAPHFSNPDVLYNGVPTGDEDKRNNARVLNESAYGVSNFRRPITARVYELPLMPGADNGDLEGFVRIRNVSLVDGEIDIYAIDDTGERFGPVTLMINASQTKHFNSGDLERGSESKGLMGGVGDGTGLWRLELRSTLLLSPRAYIRTPDRFVTSMNLLAPTPRYNPHRHHVSFFNGANNTAVRSLLRVINPNSYAKFVTIRGWDDDGHPGESPVQVLIQARSAVLISSQELEEGSPKFSNGRLGDGKGKWEILVTSSGETPVRVMSLLATNSGHLTNVSQ